MIVAQTTAVEQLSQTYVDSTESFLEIGGFMLLGFLVLGVFAHFIKGLT